MENSISYRELTAALVKVAEKNSLRVTVKSVLKGGLITGTMTVCGGLLIGPLGFILGGTLGGLAAYATSSDFKPVADIIRDDFTDQQKHEICDHVIDSLRYLHPTDIVLLASLIIKGKFEKEKELLNVIRGFFKNKHNMTIV